MKKFCLLFILAHFSGFLSAQLDIQVGSGSGSSANVPLTTNYGYNYTQHIYLASEITAAGGVPTYIQKIRYYTTSNPPANNNDWVVYMKNTPKTLFANTTDWEAGATLTQVFSGTVTFPSANNWMEITLNTPFLWDGVSNILVAVDENQSNWGNLSYWRTTTTGTDNRSIYYRNDATNPDPLTPPTATGRVTAYPNMQFVMYDGSCSGMPVHDIVEADNNTVCVGTPVTFSTDANNLRVDLNYLWQYNTGSGWINFTTSVNSWQFATSELTQSADVRAVVTCTNSSLTDTTGSVNVTINPLPIVNVSPSSYAVCSGGSAVLTASGADTYTWLPVTDLDNAALATVTSTPISDISYTVTGTDANNCTNTSSIQVSMMVNISPEVLVSPNVNCSAGSPINISLSGLPAALSGGGSYEYRFLAGDSITVVQPWGPLSTYTFTPAIDDEYSFFYQVRNTACPGEMPDSMRISFPVGFGADVSIIDFNCQHQGSFILSNIFGQSSINNVYSNLLNSAGSLTDITFSGSASISGGRAVLTPSATGVSGYMLIDLDTVELFHNNTLNVSFLLTADQPINNFGTGGADGITYSFGDDALPASPGPAHNGKGSKLRLSFDAANNGTENGNATGIYLVYGWTGSNAFGPGSAATLAYSPNTSLWKLNTDVPVNLSINSQGKATVMVDGVVVFSEIQLPPSYLTEDVSNWNHLFSAATGGDALRQAISDLSITSNELIYGITPGAVSPAPSVWQHETEFDSLASGDYTLWIANPSDTLCLKNLGVFQIDNTNPIVQLVNDTVICSGDSILLDAGNPGSNYLWSTLENTQTILVANDGAYSVYVTDSVGCIATGSINVDVALSPTADGIYASGTFTAVFLSVVNPINAAQYNWNFGDGNILINAPSTVGHTYPSMGMYTVTATISNQSGCDSVVVSKMINVDGNELSVDEEYIDELQLYPNPATDFINLILSDYTNVQIAISTVNGSIVYNGPLTSSMINVQEWANGVYFIKIHTGDQMKYAKFTVHH